MTRILLIEDESTIADAVIYALDREGMVTVWVRLAQDGLKQIQSELFDLVILDIGLPDQNGFDVCRNIRTQSSIPIIFLTARTDEIDRIVGLEIGADDYVAKPFSPRELAARVSAVLRRTRTADRSTTNARHLFVIDESHKSIVYRGFSLSLTKQEFSILCVLIENPGRVFSRAQLMNRAWNDPDASQERTIDAHVKTLRAKLREISPEEDPIRTHRGFGYSLKDPNE